MAQGVSLLVFVVEALRIALPLDVVERVEPACEITPLPGAPGAVPGAINLQGRLAAVVDLRRRLGLEARPLRTSDALVVARARELLYALPVDDLEGVVHADPGEIVPREAIAEGTPRIRGVVRTAEGLLLIEDPDAFLDINDMRELAAAVEQAGLAHGY